LTCRKADSDCRVARAAAYGPKRHVSSGEDQRAGTIIELEPRRRELLQRRGQGRSRLHDLEVTDAVDYGQAQMGVERSKVGL